MKSRPRGSLLRSQDLPGARVLDVDGRTPGILSARAGDEGGDVADQPHRDLALEVDAPDERDDPEHVVADRQPDQGRIPDAPRVAELVADVVGIERVIVEAGRRRALSDRPECDRTWRLGAAHKVELVVDDEEVVRRTMHVPRLALEQLLLVHAARAQWPC